MGAISPRSCLLLSLLAGDHMRYGPLQSQQDTITVSYCLSL